MPLFGLISKKNKAPLASNQPSLTSNSPTSSRFHDHPNSEQQQQQQRRRAGTTVPEPSSSYPVPPRRSQDGFIKDFGRRGILPDSPTSSSAVYSSEHPSRPSGTNNTPRSASSSNYPLVKLSSDPDDQPLRAVDNRLNRAYNSHDRDAASSLRLEPPSRAAVFGAYDDSHRRSQLSARSLPDVSLAATSSARDSVPENRPSSALANATATANANSNKRSRAGTAAASTSYPTSPTPRTPSQSRKLQRPALNTRQQASPPRAPPRPAENSNPKNSWDDGRSQFSVTSETTSVAPSTKSKMFGWLSFRSSSSSSTKVAGSSGNSAATTVSTSSYNNSIPPVPRLDLKLAGTGSDIAQRAKLLPYSPPDSPSPSTRSGFMPGGARSKSSTPQPPPRARSKDDEDEDDDKSFKVTGFRHVRPNPSPGPHAYRNPTSASTPSTPTTAIAKPSTSSPPSSLPRHVPTTSPSPKLSLNISSSMSSLFDSTDNSNNLNSATTNTATPSTAKTRTASGGSSGSGSSASSASTTTSATTPNLNGNGSQSQSQPHPPSSMPANFTEVPSTPPAARSKSRQDSINSDISSSGQQKLTAAAFRAQVRKGSAGFGVGPGMTNSPGGGGSPVLGSTGLPALDSPFSIGPTQRAGTPSSMRSGVSAGYGGIFNAGANASKTSLLLGAGFEEKDKESPVSSTSARTFKPSLSGSALSNMSGSGSGSGTITASPSVPASVGASAGKMGDGLGGSGVGIRHAKKRSSTGSSSILMFEDAIFAAQFAADGGIRSRPASAADLITAATTVASSSSSSPQFAVKEKPAPSELEQKTQPSSLQRHDTITQRSVSASGIGSNESRVGRPTRNGSSRPSVDSATELGLGLGRPPPVGILKSSKHGSPSSSPKVPAFPPPRSQSSLSSYARSPASLSTPVISSTSAARGASKGAAKAKRPAHAALSRDDVDSDTSESDSEKSSSDEDEENSDSEDDKPLNQLKRPSTAMSVRTTATATGGASPRTGGAIPRSQSTGVVGANQPPRPSTIAVTNFSAPGSSGLPRPSLLNTTGVANGSSSGSSNGNGLPSSSSSSAGGAAMRARSSSRVSAAPLVNLTSASIAATSRGAQGVVSKVSGANANASSNASKDGTSNSGFKKPLHAAGSRSVDAIATFSSNASSLSSISKGLGGVDDHGLLRPRHPWNTASQYQNTSSPASSTGDSTSNSGKLPLTPRDGSELGLGLRKPGGSTLGGARSEIGSRFGGGSTITAGHAKRPSVVFDLPPPVDMDVTIKAKGRSVSGSVIGAGGGAMGGKNNVDEADKETLRKERRRSEARAAIELGNVVNGPPPVISDDEDFGRLAIPRPQQQQSQQQAQSVLSGNWDNWRMSAAVNGANPQAFGAFPGIPPNADPAYLAAHHQAMMVAKQAYQMAVAQQAFQAANDEWERGSNVTGFGGGGGAGAGGGGMQMPQMPQMQMPMYNMQMPMMNMNMPMGMNMGMGMGMGMMPSMFPAAPASMYAGGGGGSTLGVGSQWGGGGGGAASVYGVSLGGAAKPSNVRRSTAGGPPPVSFPGSASVLGDSTGGLARPRPRTRTSPSGASAAAASARNSTANSRSNAPTSWRTP